MPRARIEQYNTLVALLLPEKEKREEEGGLPDNDVHDEHTTGKVKLVSCSMLFRGVGTLQKAKRGEERRKGKKKGDGPGSEMTHARVSPKGISVLYSEIYR